jgi:hypothetical protein
MGCTAIFWHRVRGRNDIKDSDADRKHQFSPDTSSMVLLGPGVNRVTTTNTMSAQNSSDDNMKITGSDGTAGRAEGYSLGARCSRGRRYRRHAADAQL